MASDGSTKLGDVEDPEDHVDVKQESPEDTNLQDFRSDYAQAAAGEAQAVAGPSVAATQDERADALPLPAHEQQVPGPSQPRPGRVHGDDEGNGAGGNFYQPYAAFPHGDALPPAQAAMMGVLAPGGNSAGQRGLTGLQRTQSRRLPPQGPAAQAANNPHRIAPVNRAANPPSPTAAFPQHAVQQGQGVAGPSRVVHPGFPGAAYPAAQWNPQAFAQNPVMGFGHTPYGPTFPGSWGHMAFANQLQRALARYGGPPQHQFIAGPSRPPGYPIMPAQAQFAAMAPQAHAAGPPAPLPAGPLAAPQHAQPPPNPAPPAQPQPNPAAAAAAVGAQAGPSYAAAAADPPAAAPQVPPVPQPRPAGLGGFECVVCHARFAQYADCTQHVIFGHVVPEFTKRMSEVPAMIHAVPDPDADA